MSTEGKTPFVDPRMTREEIKPGCAHRAVIQLVSCSCFLLVTATPPTRICYLPILTTGRLIGPLANSNHPNGLPTFHGVSFSLLRSIPSCSCSVSRRENGQNLGHSWPTHHGVSRSPKMTSKRNCYVQPVPDTNTLVLRIWCPALCDHLLVPISSMILPTFTLAR